MYIPCVFLFNVDEDDVVFVNSSFKTKIKYQKSCIIFWVNERIEQLTTHRVSCALFKHVFERFES